VPGFVVAELVGVALAMLVHKTLQTRVPKP
jgi:hypothetical protein